MLAVGICTLELHIPESGSLKGKRHVVKSLKDRLRGTFNISVAEVDCQDLWQKAVLGVACIANERRHVNEVLDKVVDFVQGTPSLELIEYKIEII
jgi:uncharacterized protein YlxP (DUF503 family)